MRGLAVLGVALGRALSSARRAAGHPDLREKVRRRDGGKEGFLLRGEGRIPGAPVWLRLRPSVVKLVTVPDYKIVRI